MSTCCGCSWENADEVRRVIEASDDGEDCAAVTDEAFFRICSALLELRSHIGRWAKQAS